MAVARITAYAQTLPRVLFVNANPQWHMKWPESGAFEIVVKMLNALFVTYRWVPVRRAGPGFSRIFPTIAMHLIEMLGFGVIRLQLVVTNRPGRRDSAVMSNLAEVFLAQAKESSAVEFGVAADEII